MKKTIVIFSNPFGYGPTGKAIAIAEAFIRGGYKNVIFAGSSFTQEIVPNSIKTIHINERNEEEIIKILQQIENPVVISSQNRFAIYAAKKLNIPSAFLDGLAWFWKDIPADHLVADIVFWMKYPHIEEKLSGLINKVVIVPAIITAEVESEKKEQILIHVGGCKNPLVEAFPNYYLDMLASSLVSISDINIVVTGGVDAIQYLRSRLDEKENKIKTISLKHEEFIKELASSKHFITTAGQTATLEAFALGIPTSFLLPMNLSQSALTDVLTEYNAAPQSLSWDTYFTNKIDILKLNEKDAIVEFGKYAENICNDPKLSHKLVSDLTSIIKNLPHQEGQKNFIEYVGTSGTDTIKDILIKEWSL